jgi:hypothetical protein
MPLTPPPAPPPAPLGLVAIAVVAPPPSSASPSSSSPLPLPPSHDCASTCTAAAAGLGRAAAAAPAPVLVAAGGAAGNSGKGKGACPAAVTTSPGRSPKRARIPRPRCTLPTRPTVLPPLAPVPDVPGELTAVAVPELAVDSTAAGAGALGAGGGCGGAGAGRGIRCVKLNTGFRSTANRAFKSDSLINAGGPPSMRKRARQLHRSNPLAAMRARAAGTGKAIATACAPESAKQRPARTKNAPRRPVTRPRALGRSNRSNAWGNAARHVEEAPGVF